MYYERLEQIYRNKFPNRSIQLEQLLVYHVFTYFCGSVYDEEVLAKIKGSVAYVIFWEMLLLGEFAGNRERFGRSSQIKIAYSYAREVEHSQDNLNQIEKMMETDVLFSVGNLKKVL